MGITRHDIEVGGTVYVKTRYVTGGAEPKQRKAEVLDIERACATIRTLDDNVKRKCRFNELDPDTEWQQEWDSKLKERTEQAARDRHFPSPRLVEPSAPSLRVGLGDALRNKGLEPPRIEAPAALEPPPSRKSRPVNVPLPPREELPQEEETPSIDAWLAQGRKLLDPLQEQVWQLDEEIQELQTQVTEMQQRLELATTTRDARLEQLAQLEKILKPGAPEKSA